MYVNYKISDEGLTAKEALAMAEERFNKEWDNPQHYHIDSVSERGDVGWSVSFSGPEHFQLLDEQTED
jgi:hypothetical protein